MDAETIAALERAAERFERTVALLAPSRAALFGEPDYAASRAQAEQDAALIRALIERERAGGERAKVVAWLRGPAKEEADRKALTAPDGSKKRRDFAVVSVALDCISNAIEAGAHIEAGE